MLGIAHMDFYRNMINLLNNAVIEHTTGPNLLINSTQTVKLTISVKHNKCGQIISKHKLVNTRMRSKRLEGVGGGGEGVMTLDKIKHDRKVMTFVINFNGGDKFKLLNTVLAQAPYVS